MTARRIGTGETRDSRRLERNPVVLRSMVVMMEGRLGEWGRS